MDKATSDADTLLHATGEFMRIVAFEALKPHQLNKERARLGPGLRIHAKRSNRQQTLFRTVCQGSNVAC